MTRVLQLMALIAALDDLNGDEGAAHPEERLECIHRQQVIEAEIERRHNHSDARKGLSVDSPAEFARNQSREQNFQSSRERGQEA